MKELSDQTIKMINFMLEISQPSYAGTALEVACGKGMLSRDLLLDKYEKVHLFDRDSAALRQVKTW